MGLLSIDLKTALLSAPPMAALYRPVFWEPVTGLGERIVAMIALEPDAASSILLSPATHVIIPPVRLRAMLGKQRGDAATGILEQAAQFITLRQQAGLPLDEIQPPFAGMTLGAMGRIRGHSVNQILDAAVRSCSAFGTADALIEDADPQAARHTMRTAEFIDAVRRRFTASNPSLLERFDTKLTPQQDLPPLTVDYAANQWLVQFTSLPSTSRQAINTQREAQSKLFEIDQIRKHMQGNILRPALLINKDALINSTTTQTQDVARTMLERLAQLARANDMQLLQAATPEHAVELLQTL